MCPPKNPLNDRCSLSPEDLLKPSITVYSSDDISLSLNESTNLMDRGVLMTKERTFRVQAYLHSNSLIGFPQASSKVRSPIRGLLTIFSVADFPVTDLK